MMQGLVLSRVYEYKYFLWCIFIILIIMGHRRIPGREVLFIKVAKDNYGCFIIRYGILHQAGAVS